MSMPFEYEVRVTSVQLVVVRSKTEMSPTEIITQAKNAMTYEILPADRWEVDWFRERHGQQREWHGPQHWTAE